MTRFLRRGAWLLMVSLLLATGPVNALNQTQMDIIGVSRNLELLGVMETWVADGSGFPHCEIRLYQKNRWEPVETWHLPNENEEPTDNVPEMNKRCHALKTQVIEDQDLHDIEWDLADMSPEAPKIKDKQGRLLSPGPEFAQQYPALQRYHFTLPPTSDAIDVLVKSSNAPNAYQLAQTGYEQAGKKPGYRVVLRPTEEPVPFDVVDRAYENYQLLITPIKMMISDHYGLIAIIFRDTHYGFEGFDYHYRPYFIKWPTMQPMSVEEARNNLIKATGYAMEPDELALGPNTRNLSYRSFVRLRHTKLPPDEIITALHRSSNSGKLYWLALLHEQDPQAYRQAAQSVLKARSIDLDVIQVMGEQWRTRNFHELIRQQAQGFRQTL